MDNDGLWLPEAVVMRFETELARKRASLEEELEDCEAHLSNRDALRLRSRLRDALLRLEVLEEDGLSLLADMLHREG